MTWFNDPNLIFDLLISAVVEISESKILPNSLFGSEEVEPIVFDLVDNHPSLKKHFGHRKKVYTKAGGVIKDYKKAF